MTDCAFSFGIAECQILSEKICLYNQCSFYKDCIEYERDKNKDYLHESYLKGNINAERYAELVNRYHKK